jgi:pimeloyl-ACP methyl ester carboxylesterase
MGPLTDLGYAVCGMNTRFASNDSGLIMEEAVLDVGAVVRYLRERFEKIVLIGNSGGASLMAFYQAEAEAPSVTATPAGDGPDLTQAGLIPADGYIAVAGHPGRAAVLTGMIDAAAVDEDDMSVTDPALDMFNPRNGPPYDLDWLAVYRQAQVDRNARITRRVLEGLEKAKSAGIRDRSFLVFRTCADPRNLDLSIEPSEREVGSLWGDARWVNTATAAGQARYTSLRSWLSQWSLEHTNADGPSNVARVSAPVSVIAFAADQAVYASHSNAYYDAAKHPAKRLTVIKGATHYLVGQPEQTRQTAEEISRWIREVGLNHA